ncbi:ROK family protein [Oceanicaulis sp.]|uniref:ROK family protein n=1 Tax=Oceanicaulis sp. TaxID=1924941 RepID=UPI003F6F0B92
MIKLGDLNLTERERAVLTLVRQHGQLTRARLMKLTGLSGPAVFRATESLSKQGFLKIGGQVVEGRGQPSHQVMLNADSAFVLGVSILTDTAEIALVDLCGAVRAVDDIVEPPITREVVHKAIHRFIETHLPEGLHNQVAAIGLTVPGFFIGEGDKLNPASELDDWALLDLEAEFQTRYGLPVYVENNANAAAVGEHLLGVGGHVSNFAYVSIASGFGGGVMLEGRLWRGAHGNAAEFAASLKVAGVTPPSLETLRSTLQRHGVTTENVRDLIQRFDLDWPGVSEWIQETAAPALHTLALLVHYTIDVEALVIGGRLPQSLREMLAEKAKINYEERAKHVRRDRPHPVLSILPAEVGERAYLIGAAAIPLADLFFRPVSVRADE